MNKIIKRSCIVHLDRLTKIYGTNENKTVALHQISFQSFSGELILLIGPSGSGKTTLLTLIAGLTKPTTGTVSLFEKDIEHYTPRELQRLRAKRIGFIFQTFFLIDSLTAMENVEVVLHFTGKHRRDAHRQAMQLLHRFHMGYLSKRFPPSMSQGEKQRVAVIRALANNADLILADEPTGSLESKQGFDIIRLLQNYTKEHNKCVIVASHDLRLVDYADRILRLEDGMLRKGD